MLRREIDPGQPSKRRADPLNLVDGSVVRSIDSSKGRPKDGSADNFEFGYAVKDDAKGDDFSHKVKQS